MRTAALTLMMLFISGGIYGTEIPIGASVIYRGVGDVSGYSVAYFRDVDGGFWRWFIRDTDDTVESETRFGGLGGLRASLLAIDDRAGVMGSTEWLVDSDGDGFSNMLEYLTNGDPYDLGVNPTEPRILYFDGGQAFEALLPVKDMSGGDTSGGQDFVSAAVLEQYVGNIVFLISFSIGLMLWRLTILSMSRRNIL